DAGQQGGRFRRAPGMRRSAQQPEIGSGGKAKHADRWSARRSRQPRLKSPLRATSRHETIWARSDTIAESDAWPVSGQAARATRAAGPVWPMTVRADLLQRLRRAALDRRIKGSREGLGLR